MISAAVSHGASVSYYALNKLIVFTQVLSVEAHSDLMVANGFQVIG